LKITLRRGLAMLLTAAILCCAAAAVFVHQDRNAVPASVDIKNHTNVDRDSIEKFRTERQLLRAMQKAQLNDIIHDAGSDSATADMARRQLLEIYASEEQELTIEGILSMRGFVDPVATVHSGSVNVILRAQSLTRAQSSVILDLVCRETGAMSGDVKIIPIN